MASVAPVDFVHQASKRLAVGRCVGKAVIADMIVDHLVDHHVLPHLLREVKSLAEMEREDAGSGQSGNPRPNRSAGTRSQLAAGPAQSDFNWLQSSVEEKAVSPVECLFDEIFGDDHGMEDVEVERSMRSVGVRRGSTSSLNPEGEVQSSPAFSSASETVSRASAGRLFSSLR